MSKRATAHAVCVAFCLTYLLAMYCGAGGMAALMRGVGVAFATMLLGQFLARPAVDAVLTAMARDRAELQKQQEQAE